jgi:hypothetical protein
MQEPLLHRQTTPMRSRLKSWTLLLCATLAAACLISVTAGAAAHDVAPAGKPGATPAAPATDGEEAPVAQGGLEFKAPLLGSLPAAGKGRLSLVMEGNRRWCTYRDDRVARPPEMKSQRVGGPPPSRDDIFTFGYQFTIAAVERSHPGETLMLFESPIIRTAVMREAAKLGRGIPSSVQTPQVPDSDDTNKKKAPSHEMPSSLVPMWQEQFRCAKVPETIDFDLDPGIYDIYMAFDILLRSGGWAHRSIAFETDVVVRADATTRLDGVVNQSGGARREVRLSPASPAPERSAPAGGR